MLRTWLVLCALLFSVCSLAFNVFVRYAALDPSSSSPPVLENPTTTFTLQPGQSARIRVVLPRRYVEDCPGAIGWRLADEGRFFSCELPDGTVLWERPEPPAIPETGL